MNVDFNIINQKGSPAIFSDTYANRPAASYPGRLFISTDTKEIYRDTGSAWEEIAGSGSGNIQGSGTANYVPKFTDTETIGNSQIRDDGTGVGIGVAPSAVYKLDISGSQRNTLTAAGGLSIVQSGVLEASYGVYNSSSGAAFLFEKFDDATATFTDSGIFANGGFYTKVFDGTTNFYNSFFSNGNVGIGVVADNGTKFNISGTFAVSGNATFDTNTLFVDAANDRVGIGTVSPDELLTLSANVPVLKLTSTNAGGKAYQFFSNSDGNFYLRNATTSTNLMVVTNSNNVLIGTTTDSGFKLDVNGTGNFTSALSGTSATFSGNVGIGVTPIITSGGSFNQIFIGGSGQGGVLYGQNNAGSIALLANAYFNASNVLKYINTGNLVGQIYNYDGEFIFSNAPSGTSGGTVTLTPRLTIASTGAATFSGAVEIGNTVAVSVATPSTHKVTMLIGGVTYYLLASNV